MRMRPVLHEAENEAEAKTHEAEVTKFGLEAVRVSSTYHSWCVVAHFPAETGQVR